jgi:hypothetical protein
MKGAAHTAVTMSRKNKARIREKDVDKEVKLVLAIALLGF